VEQGQTNMLADTIFVLIPSYRDTELVHTLTCLFDTAREPGRVFVGVFLQDQDDVQLTLDERWAPNVRIKRWDQGCGCRS
jgi:hypothetical protein